MRTNWIQTITGRVVELDDVKPEDIELFDIAHALSHTSRWTGHCPTFYSVAQHSVLLSRICRYPATQLQALFHDAQEAYLGDVSTPLKSLIGDKYDQYENEISAVIAKRFGIHYPFDPLVKQMDGGLLHTESCVFFGPTSPASVETQPKFDELDAEGQKDLWELSNVTFQNEEPKEARNSFISRYLELRDQ